MPKKKTPHTWVSWSQIDMWHKCGAMYKAHHYLKKKADRTYDMRLGSAAHKGAQAIVNATLKGVQLSPDDARVIARAAVKQEMTAMEILPNDWMDLVHGLGAWARECYFRKGELHGSEIECNVPYSADHNVVFRGKIDAAFNMGNGFWEILDLKNSRQIWRKDKLKDSRQLPVYCWMVLERIPGITKLRAGHWYLRHQSYNMVDIDPDEVYCVKEWIDQALEGITSGKFPARVNQECGRCKLRGSCKEYKARYIGIKGGRPKNGQDAHDKLDKIGRTIKLLEVEKADLRDYMSDQANKRDQILVESGSLAWYHRVEERRVMPLRKMVSIYAKKGIDLLEKLTAKTTEMDVVTKPLIRSLPSKLAQDKFLAEVEKAQIIEKRTKLVLGKPLPIRKKPTKKRRKNASK